MAAYVKIGASIHVTIKTQHPTTLRHKNYQATTDNKPNKIQKYMYTKNKHQSIPSEMYKRKEL